MKTILFHLNELCERGTAVAVYNYAHYNETILGNKSVVVTKKMASHNQLVVKKFKDRFKSKFYFYSTNDKLKSIIENDNVDVFYVIKYGFDDGIKPLDLAKNIRQIKYVVHCVFETKYPHGDVCASISKHLNDMHNTSLPVVPYIVSLNESNSNQTNLRSQLNIPHDAVVFGRYGGYNQFDINFVHKAIIRIVNENNNKYFIFANTSQFYSHKNIIYLDTIVDTDEKVKFINTTDAMIHARSDGETFGLACAEFSICNKPIITSSNVGAQAHSSVLKDKGIYYTDEESCYKILKEFDANNKNKDLNIYNVYDEYTPDKVMKVFEKIFLN